MKGILGSKIGYRKSNLSTTVMTGELMQDKKSRKVSVSNEVAEAVDISAASAVSASALPRPQKCSYFFSYFNVFLIFIYSYIFIYLFMCFYFFCYFNVFF